MPQDDGIRQSQQLLSGIQSTTDVRPDAIIFEPAGSSAHPQVARAAAAAGIGVVVLNRDANYLADLRSQFHAPVFAITSNHEEIGRIQGRQLAGPAAGRRTRTLHSRAPRKVPRPSSATPARSKSCRTACSFAC